MAEQPRQRSMGELRAIIAAEDRKRTRLLDAFEDLREDDQLRVIELAEQLHAELAAEADDDD